MIVYNNILEDSLQFNYKSYYTKNGFALTLPYLYEIYRKILQQPSSIYIILFGTRGGTGF